MAFSHRLAHNTMSKVIREVCSVIYEEVGPRYIKCPQSPEEWLRIVDGWWTRWNLPNTLGEYAASPLGTPNPWFLGAVDGKHIEIKKPPKSGSLYYNYKGHFSMVLLAVCDYKYRILYADFGNYGSDGDSRIYSRSDFNRALTEGTMGIPADAALPNSHRVLPHFFVADNAFTLTKNMMAPLPGVGRSKDERIFNYRYGL